MWALNQLVSLLLIPNSCSISKLDIANQASFEQSQAHPGEEFIDSAQCHILSSFGIRNEFLPVLPSVTLADRISALESMISLLCLGNKVNSEVVLAAFPPPMSQALNPQQSYMLSRHFTYIPPPSEQIYAIQFAEKMRCNKSAWHVLFFLIKQRIENPILLWTFDSLNFLKQHLIRQCENLDYLRRIRYVILRLIINVLLT
jgi:hypothetical protein